MKTYLVFITAICIGLAASSQQLPRKWFSIKAFLPQWENAVVRLQKNDREIGSGKIQNDIFSFNSSTTEPAWASLHLMREGRQLVVPFFIEPGTIRVRSIDPYNLYVTGTPLNDAYLNFNHETDSVASLKNVKDTRMIKRAYAAEFIRKNPASLVSLRLMKEFFYLDRAADDSLYFSLYNLLDDKLKKTVTGYNIKSEVLVRYHTMTGKQAPLVVVRDTANAEQRLYTPGVTTIIHFEASWCMPCKRELVSLKKAFERLRPSGVQVVSVSLENNTIAWKRSISVIDTNWKHYIDLKAFGGESAKMYGVKSIPDNFLIGPDGKLLGRHLSVAEIERILENIPKEISVGEGRKY